MASTAADPLDAALAHHRSGNLALAEQLYRQCLARKPQNAHAWHLLGALCLQAGRSAEAVEYIGSAIALEPGNADFHSHLGAAYGAQNRHGEAVTALERAAEIAPNSGAVQYNLGTALRNAGRLPEAAESFRRAVQANPGAAEAHYNLANALRDLNKLEEAEQSYRSAMQARPHYVKAMINLGTLLLVRGRHAESVEVLRTAVATDPRHAGAHFNLATALRDSGQFAAAAASAQAALALQPNMAEAYTCLGTAWQAEARFDDALACYDRALSLDAQLADAHYCRSLHRLRLGHLAEGFAEMEWRWKSKSYSQRVFAEPRWHGEPLEGRTILLHAEQGLGDTLNFVRYAANVKARGGQVTVECQPALFQLLANYQGIDKFVAPGESPKLDLECPLMSLPGVLQLTSDTLWQGPYLSAEPARVERWRERLGTSSGLRVGLCWQGNPKHLFDFQRSFKLRQLAPLAAVPGVQLISLQKGPGAEQVADCGFELLDVADELDVDTGAFVDTAAVLTNLDLVITSDTSIAHLAGGLGVPVWVALSAHGDWRWGVDRSDTPWYPSMRLFRQPALGKWDGVFAEITAALRDLAAR